MDSGDSAKFSSYLGKLPKYTGTKDEDRPKFVQDFVVLCETVRRLHDASTRQELRSVSGTQMTDAQRNQLRSTQPDWQMVWGMTPSLLAGEGNRTIASPAYSWWCESYAEEGLVVSKMNRVLNANSLAASYYFLQRRSSWMGLYYACTIFPSFCSLNLHAFHQRQTYTSCIITGTLMWDKKEHEFCVLVETVAAHWKLLEKVMDHTGCGNRERMVEELRLPFYYEIR
ncbi:hypothetical protein CYMTET_40567 [Cymbomonas tetramitiformis]|uniref:Uncharacterized protein n=1 Tax=Cymbomonas tetramitiformis TaxID=36881 RepID=A0AAE0C9V3_9CHLO|nr:hypothetical protein CYMTET_40567 [Cymbomonas tetramitiformis]